MSVMWLANFAIFGTFACAAIGWAARKAWKGIRRWTRFLDDYEGTDARPGVPARPGVMQRLESMEQSVSEVQRAIGQPNGVPLGTKIEKLWAKYLTDEERAHS